uniref:Uncharacterized protein n=1 Tax=Magallana gigas TaxID=29159 RepID=K1QWR9_MAGGI
MDDVTVHSRYISRDKFRVSTYQSQFIGVLVAFCIVLGASTAYFTMKRIKKYKEKQHVENQSKASPKQRQDEQPNVYTNETLDIDYQELGELKKPEIYDTTEESYPARTAAIITCSTDIVTTIT